MKDFCINAEQMVKDTREKNIVDLRKEEDFKKGSCEGAINIYWKEFEEQIPNFSKDKPLYLVCYTGETSDEFAEYLCGKGYEAYSIKEGYRGYMRWKLINMM
jgi:rhodanese-related sulfurtransferase